MYHHRPSTTTHQTRSQTAKKTTDNTERTLVFTKTPSITGPSQDPQASGSSTNPGNTSLKLSTRLKRNPNLLSNHSLGLLLFILNRPVYSISLSTNLSNISLSTNLRHNSTNPNQNSTNLKDSLTKHHSSSLRKGLKVRFITSSLSFLTRRIPLKPTVSIRANISRITTPSVDTPLRISILTRVLTLLTSLVNSRCNFSLV